MMYRFQKPLSIVTVLLCAGFFLNAALDGYRPSVCANDIACSAGFIRTVDRLITSIGKQRREMPLNCYVSNRAL